MRKIPIWIFFLLVTILAIPNTGPAAAREKRDLVLDPPLNQRLALVIGNGDYNTSPLKNPAHDAQDMARLLKDLGFEVIHLENADKRKMVEAINDFGRRLRSADVGLFYFAGHGLQTDGINYLLPIGTRLETESDIEFEAVDAGRVLGKMEEAENRVNIVILDACRNNPFMRKFRTSERGLARMDAPKGSFIAFATAPGSVARDGEGRNGVFTKHLLRHMKNSGLKIEDVLKQTRVGVLKETADTQIPWQSSSLTGDFYFALPDAETVSVPAPPELLPDYDALAEEREAAAKKWAAWQQAMETEYKKVEGHELNGQLPPLDKAGFWDIYLSAFKNDNPYTARDDRLRENARQRKKYWDNLARADVDRPLPKPSHSESSKVSKGIIHDSRTGLEWYAGPDADITWDEAKTWAEKLTVDGGGWRMPFDYELKTLYIPGAGPRNMDPRFQTSGWWVWTGGLRNQAEAWIYSFKDGRLTDHDRHGSGEARVFAVRSSAAITPHQAALSRIIYDPRTNLEWYAGPDGDITWDEAKAWVEKLTADGGGWRMPTAHELKSLYQPNKAPRNLNPGIQTTGWWVWTGKLKNSRTAWIFSYKFGELTEYARHGSGEARVFAVRSRK